MTMNGDVERHLQALLASYGGLETNLARVETLLKERNDEALRARARVDDELKEKAAAKDLVAVVNELASIKRLLVLVLMAIVTASIGFGFAALQIAGNHP